MTTAEQLTTLDRSKPPTPGPIPVVAFPSFVRRELANGLEVYVVENHEQPIVSLSVYVRGGSITDPAQHEGITAVMADMLTKGTQKRNAIEIAEEIDFIGGALHSGASWDANTLSTTVLTKYLDKGLELLSDCLLNSTFPDEELERVRLQRLAALRQAKADAGYLADTVFTKLVFPNHPYGQQASGSEQSLAAITTDAIRAHYASLATPTNSFVVASGDVDPDALLAMLEKLMGGWSGERRAAVEYPMQSQQTAASVALVDKPSAVQSALRIGHLGISRTSPDYVGAYVLNMLLGGYFNSRINLNLREKHGFTYGARSYFDARMEAGPFAVSTEVGTPVTVRAIEESLSELRRITLEPVTEDELSMVKNYVVGSFPLQIETPQQVASRVATIVLYGLSEDYFDTFRHKVVEVSREELLRVAQRQLNPDNITIVVAGDQNALQTALGAFGPVQVFSSEGELLETHQSI